MDQTADVRGGLACCHGFAVAAGDRVIGTVETPIFDRASGEPLYLVMRVVRSMSQSPLRCVVVSLIAEVDADARRVVLDADADVVARLPVSLPRTSRPSVGGA